MQDQPQSTTDQRQLTLVKQGQQFVFRYATGDEQVALESMASEARDPRSCFDWFDAAVLSHQMGSGMSRRLSRLKDS